MHIQMSGFNRFLISASNLTETAVRIGHMKGPGLMLEIFQLKGANPQPEA